MAPQECLDAFNECPFVAREVIALRVPELEQLRESYGYSRFSLM
jgi:hypothetical protein